MRFLHSFIVLFLIFGITSCRDDFHFEPADGSELSFSKDTVYLDTIFSNIGSSTYNLKVYNNSNKDIKIPSIRLKNGENSGFRLMVDGISGKSFENVELLANDSLFVFVETTVDIKEQTNDKEFLYTDEILFHSSSQQQHVNLVTLVRDAIFLYPKRFPDDSYETININGEAVYGFFLDDDDELNGNELIWNNEKPYVIYGYAAVPPNKVLEISEGANVHFHKGSALLVFSNAQINAEGSIDHPIVFQGDRLEPYFEDVEGQWDMVLFGNGSKGVLKNILIKNAVIGINAQSQDLQLENLQIYNCSNYGIIGINAKINGKNIVTNNMGRAALALSKGGIYDFTHCTFANYWNRQNHTAVIIDNDDGSNEFAIQAHFKNSIIYGNSNESLLLYPGNETVNFDVKMENTLIKFFNTANRFPTGFPFDFEDTTRFENCLIAKNTIQFRPYFFNTEKNQLMITDQAENLIGFGKSIHAQEVPLDLNGINRTTSPDLGAYQHVDSPQD